MMVQGALAMAAIAGTALVRNGGLIRRASNSLAGKWWSILFYGALADFDRPGSGDRNEAKV